MGRNRSACQKCTSEHKKCVREYNDKRDVVGCKRCLDMPSVQHCTLAHTYSLFQQYSKHKKPSPDNGVTGANDINAIAEGDEDDALLSSSVENKSKTVSSNSPESNLDISTRGNGEMPPGEIKQPTCSGVTGVNDRIANGNSRKLRHRRREG